MAPRILRSRAFYLIAILVMVAVYLGSQLRPTDPRPIGNASDIAGLRDRADLNVLFVLIDTLRADHLGSYGYERDTSPNLDALAARGIRFANHVSQCSWTKSSMASMWTGLNPARTGVHRYMHALPDEALLPAEILAEQGFRTVGIWRNGWVAPNFGFSQGFDVYVRPNPAGVPPTIRHAHPGAIVAGSDLDATQAALEFLRTVREGDRWMLYLHLMDVHQYMSDAESARFGTTYPDLYDNAIHWTDRNLGLLLETLRDRGHLENTLVVVASDHGEAFREHETEGHARNLYAEVIQTPLIISLPYRLDEPLVVESTSANIDVWPTILDLLDAPPLPSADGMSLLEAIENASNGRVPEEERMVFSDLDTGWGNPKKPSNRIIAATRLPYRAHERNAEGFEVYDLDADPAEQENLAAGQVEIADELQSAIQAYTEADEIPWQPQEVELDSMMLNQLRALGYKIE
jgi:arylsulfatase A-like enzyme